MTEAAEYQPEPTPQSASVRRARLKKVRPDEAPDPPQALAHLFSVAKAMHEMLTACETPPESTPDVEAVHQLRTNTRRVEATLETLAREAGARGLGAATERARQRWLRQLKKVRQAAGSVRDLDVHRELLAENFLPEHAPASDNTERELAGALATTAQGEPAATVQARSLDRWLTARRSSAAHALRTALHGRAPKLLAAQQQFVAAFSKRRARARTHRPAAMLALEDYLRLTDTMPHLDAANLHDFRKGAKKARYVAEAGGDDHAALAMAKAIKRVQDAIGDWHDWEVLAAESREALGAEGTALEAELDRRVKREYERALRMTASMGRRFIGEWQALYSRGRRPRGSVTTRKPD